MSFIELLKNGNYVSILKRNFSFLVTEMFKLKRRLSPTQITELIPQIKTGANCEIMPI